MLNTSSALLGAVVPIPTVSPIFVGAMLVPTRCQNPNIPVPVGSAQVKVPAPLFRSKEFAAPWEEGNDVVTLFNNIILPFVST